MSRVFAISGVVHFGAVVALLHAWRPDVRPSRDGVSAYASGDTAGLTASAFVALAVALGAMALQIPTRGGREGIAAVLVGGWMFLLVAAFPAGGTRLRHAIHTLAAVGAFTAIALAALIVPTPDPRLGQAVALATIALFASMSVARPFAGFIQRVVFLLIAIWILDVVGLVRR